MRGPLIRGHQQIPMNITIKDQTIHLAMIIVSKRCPIRRPILLL